MANWKYKLEQKIENLKRNIKEAKTEAAVMKKEKARIYKEERQKAQTKAIRDAAKAKYSSPKTIKTPRYSASPPSDSFMFQGIGSEAIYGQGIGGDLFGGSSGLGSGFSSLFNPPKKKKGK